MADKRLKAMLRDPRIKRTLERSGFTMNDAVAGVALASASVLTNEDGAIQTISPEGKPTLPTGLISLREDIGNSTQLAAIPTRELQVGTAILVNYGGTGRVYILRDSSSSSGDDFVRPNDYDATENRRSWALLSLSFYGIETSSFAQFTTGFTANGYSYIDYINSGYTATLNIADISTANVTSLSPQTPASDTWMLPQGVNASYLSTYGYLGYLYNYSGEAWIA